MSVTKIVQSGMKPLGVIHFFRTQINADKRRFTITKTMTICVMSAFICVLITDLQKGRRHDG